MELDTQSEAPGAGLSFAYSSFIDTKSEPPGYILSYAPAKAIKTPLPSSRSVASAERSVITTSSLNSSKLDRKLQGRRVSVGSRQTKQRSRSVASSSKKKESSVASNSNSQHSSRSRRSKSSLPSTAFSKKSCMQLALVPKSTTIDPPADCHNSSAEYNMKKSAVSSFYSPLTPYSEDSTEKGTRLDSIESESESESEGFIYEEEDSYTKESEVTPEVPRELVIREEPATTKVDNYALVEYKESAVKYDEEVERVIVPAKSNYLAAAVDNHGAMVLLNSDIYEAYDHTFVSCPEHLRLRLLYTFLKKNLDKKVIIYCSTIDSVEFISKLLGRFKIPVCTMHSLQKREKFTSSFFKFSDLKEGVLCTTDESGRDLDIPPSVDYVLQFDPPADPSEYIMRIGRISCDSDRVGRSILFLNPGETGFLKYYDAAAIPVSEYELPPRLADIQSKIESRVNGNDQMLKLAKNAYGSYLIAYASHGFRDVYNVHDLNKDDVAAAFGLVSIPGDDNDDNTYCAGRKSQSTQKDWMRGKKKVWPHCRVKVHPTFSNKNTQVVNENSSQMEGGNSNA